MIRIDVLDASDNKVGEGPITVETVTIRRSLDKMGGCDFPVMATSLKAAAIGAGRKYQVYHRDYGLLGTFRHASQSLAVGNKPLLSVKADDQLVELMYKNCYFRRNFNYVAVDSVVSSLIGLVDGWSVGAVESDIGHTTVSYEGESVFEALDVLRDRWGRHFRLSAGRTVDFGAFGADSGLRLIRVGAGVPRELAANADAALITELSITEESEGVVNRLIAVGAGAGTTQLTLEHVTEADGSYPVKSGLNADNSPFFYIEDGASQATYGLVERPFERPDIRPLTNSTPDLENAANALYWASLAMLLRWRSPRVYYAVRATKLDPRRVQPGDLVRVVYRGVAGQGGRPYKWVDVDDLLWVLDIEETYSADGRQSVTLAVATTSERRTADSDVLAGLMRDTKVLKAHVQPNLTHSPVGPYVKRMDSSRPATFNVRLKEEVLAVNRVVLRFITNSLRSSVAGAAAGGSSSQTSQSGGGGTQTSQSGGGGTQTSQSGGGGTQTSQSGGGGSQTSQSGGGGTTPGTSGAHLHDLPGGGQTGYSGSQHTHLLSDHSHSVNIPSHTHQVSIPSHTHQVSIPSHTHQVSIPNHTHQVTIPNHTHPMNYGLFEDNQYPRSLRVVINGVDATAALGGPWAPSNAGVDVEMEITDYIKRGQDNTVAFSCTAGQGELTFLADCLLTIQAIVVV